MSRSIALNIAIIGIIYLIGYIIVQSKKSNDDNFIMGVDYTTNDV